MLRLFKAQSAQVRPSTTVLITVRSYDVYLRWHLNVYEYGASVAAVSISSGSIGAFRKTSSQCGLADDVVRLAAGDLAAAKAAYQKARPHYEEVSFSTCLIVSAHCQFFHTVMFNLEACIVKETTTYVKMICSWTIKRDSCAPAAFIMTCKSKEGRSELPGVLLQVEVLYESFPDIDKDIDNRPYAYPNGEALCGAEDPFARGKEFQVRDIFQHLRPCGIYLLWQSQDT